MNRTTWLQDRRMQKFRDVLSRWEAGELSMMEAGELLGASERRRLAAVVPAPSSHVPIAGAPTAARLRRSKRKRL